MTTFTYQESDQDESDGNEYYTGGMDARTGGRIYVHVLICLLSAYFSVTSYPSLSLSLYINNN